MKRTFATMLGVFTIAIMVLGVPAAHAAETPTGAIDSQGNRIVFSTGSLTATFEGMVPRVTFYDHNSIMREVQQVNFRSLIEFNDADHNGVYESNEAVATAVLDEGSWAHSNFYALPNGAGVAINLTQASPMNMGPGRTLPSGSVVLIVRAYNTTHTITVDNKQVTVNTSELKFDVVIKSWQPFQTSGDMLALQVNLHSSSEHYDLVQDSGTQTVDGSHDEGATTMEHDFHETSDVEQETRLSTGIVTTSSTIGFFRFVNHATVTSPGGVTSSVPVTASFKSEQDNDGGLKAVFMKLYLAYPNFQGTLVHDPSVGLGSGFPTLYLIVAGAAAAGLVAVVVIRRRHPQVQKDSVRN
ncbi:MAG TPA: hypothetical protein VFE96_09105 [Candidatus Bathyarchaeia archaeon]|nr:hypothetical protein [Candidatus Bathyarchaeia archaeon]